ncbi:hypothetical protein GN244_ATG19445 [Phytophthora infestans]|uniref:Uncharacterized protein n=1 Tax=Phytophthora infestans TaxID=4787 RepID=A0A833VU75_PHYIN|nr:hypothetical protein GN244_ATG19445 [Phytophthora infestans]
MNRVSIAVVCVDITRIYTVGLSNFRRGRSGTFIRSLTLDFLVLFAAKAQQLEALVRPGLHPETEALDTQPFDDHQLSMLHFIVRIDIEREVREERQLITMESIQHRELVRVVLVVLGLGSSSRVVLVLLLQTSNSRDGRIATHRPEAAGNDRSVAALG